jgi:hypothetical protein
MVRTVRLSSPDCPRTVAAEPIYVTAKPGVSKEGSVWGIDFILLWITITSPHSST